jgi:hypothetical protein
MWFKFLAKSAMSGVILVLVGLVATWFVSQTSLKVTLPPECAAWNQHHVMELTLFVAGVLLYFTNYGLDYLVKFLNFKLIT